MNKFTEDKLEQAFIELLGNKKYKNGLLGLNSHIGR